MKFIMSGPILACAALLAHATVVSAADAETGFVSIFNGKDLTGWKGDARFWSVKDGAITGQTTTDNPAPHNTFLIWTNGTLGDFELRLSYKIVPNNDKSFGDSGIQYRSKEMPDFVVAGYQANLMVTKPLTGILYEEKGRGIIHQLGQKVVIKTDPNDASKHKVEVVGSFGQSEEIQASFKTDDWNDYVVIAQGNHLQQFINGKQTADVTDQDEPRAAKTGVLALQLHAGQPMTVQFKNIRMKTLSSEAGSATDEIKKLEGVWEVASGEVNGGPMPADDTTGITLTVAGNKYTVVKGDFNDHGSFSIDATKNPKQMDVRPETGSGAGRTMLAIYEAGTDSLRVCYATEGSERPKAFTTEADSGRVMIAYKRKKQ